MKYFATWRQYAANYEERRQILNTQNNKVTPNWSEVTIGMYELFS